MSTNLGIHDFWIFLTTGILLNLTPGPDTFYIPGRSLAQGRRAGVASVLGISTGSLIHTLAAATGMSAILATSSAAFTVVKMIGAGYLIYLGLRMMFSRAATSDPATFVSETKSLAVYRQGMLTNLLNPKVAMFFLAFVPQFIAADSETKFAAFVALGSCFITTGTLWCLFLVWCTASLGKGLRNHATHADGLRRFAAMVFVFLGVRLAASKL